MLIKYTEIVFYTYIFEWAFLSFVFPSNLASLPTEYKLD